ncbi:ylMBF1 [Thelephora ganbajun]|uniref:YlMBF1 n=1 Tax=Thelephora ganbajun TaxID=370292 RepID=A0ACB6YZH5_THEGA|nr:ylMBF1 [Thelephora ganbajun]
MNGATADLDYITVIESKSRKPRVTRKESDVNEARRTGDVVGTYRKFSGGTNKAHQSPDHQKIAKIDRENEIAPPPKVSASVGKVMQQARMEKGLSRKDCAQKINEKPSVLQNYETGKAVPNAQILSKLERVLGVKLRGSGIGNKLEGPVRL